MVGDKNLQQESRQRKIPMQIQKLRTNQKKNNKQIRNRGNTGDAWTKTDKPTKSKGTTQT